MANYVARDSRHVCVAMQQDSPAGLGGGSYEGVNQGKRGWRLAADTISRARHRCVDRNRPRQTAEYIRLQMVTMFLLVTVVIMEKKIFHENHIVKVPIGPPNNQWTEHPGTKPAIQ